MGSYEPALKKARSSYDPTADALHDHAIANGHCAAYDVTVSAAALEDDTAPGVDPELGGQLQHAAPHYYSNGAANGNGNGNGNGIGSANGNGNDNSNGNGNGARCSDCNGVSYYADPQEQQQQHQQLQGDLECRRYTTTEGCPYDERDLGQQPSALGSKTRPCIKFFSTAGCPYGEGCHFLHYVPGGITALGLAPYSSVNPTATSAGVRKVVGGVGPAGTANGASAADPSVTVGGYKTRLCNRYNTPEGCRFADKCHFAHGESDLRPSNGRNGAPPLLDLSGASGIYSNGLPAYNPVGTSVYYGEPTPPGVSATCCFGATSTTKMSIEAVFAGAIIGKAGSNVKQISRLTGAKLSIRDHENDPNMRNVEMEGSLEQIEKAREMVRNFLQNREVQPARPASLGSHNFKTKLCENYAQGTCTFADRCHFAHGEHELRTTPIMR